LHGTFAAFTIYGTVLAIDLDAHELVHTEAVGPDRPLAALHIPRTLPWAFILFDNPDLQPFAPRDHKPSGPIIVVRRQPMPGGTFAFRNSFHPTYLTADAEVVLDGAGTTAFIECDAAEGQYYRLACIAHSKLPLAIRNQITLIERVVAISLTRVLYLLREAPLATGRLWLHCWLRP
jgi:hypothetical protein